MFLPATGEKLVRCDSKTDLLYICFPAKLHSYDLAYWNGIHIKNEAQFWPDGELRVMEGNTVEKEGRLRMRTWKRLPLSTVSGSVMLRCQVVIRGWVLGKSYCRWWPSDVG